MYIQNGENEMTLKELVYKARSYRRFKENQPVSMQLLMDVADMARVTPSSANSLIQRYAVSTSRDMNAKIFPQLKWAGKLTDWGGPAEGERPTAYIVIGCDNDYPQFHKTDTGIAAQTIQLGLAEAGVACCMIGSFNAKAVHDIVGFPEDVAATLVIAAGYPGETVVMEEIKTGENTAYWRDEKSVHHVPKRKLEDVVLTKYE